MELREYQKTAVDRTFKQWDAGMRKTLLVMPTGTGKTVCFGEVARRAVDGGGRVLVLAHRDELIRQAASKVAAVSGAACGVEKAQEHAGFEPIVVGSIQTLCRGQRLDALSGGLAGGFTHVIVDEAHHAVSDSYQKVLGALPDANVLGVTATPDRADKAQLGEFFDSVAFEYFMTDAVRDGYLCHIAAKQIPLEIDFTNVKSHHGDFDATGTATALDPYLERIADVMAVECAGRKTLVFLPLVTTSRRFADMLRLRGMDAREINGKSVDRRDALEWFDGCETGVLCNSMLLTEGWDCPTVDCVVVLRPTKSRALYAQMVGRGTRISPGKENLLLLDFLWLTQEHRLVKPAHLVSKRGDVADKMCEALSAGEQLDLLELMESAENDVVADRERALADKLREQRRKQAKLVDPLQYAVSIECSDLADWAPTFAWEMEPATEKQIGTLEFYGIAATDIGCKGFASQILDRLATRREMGLSTPKQIRFLERKGFAHVGTWSKDDASAMIGRISSNRWTVPRSIDPSSYAPDKTRKAG